MIEAEVIEILDDDEARGATALSRLADEFRGGRDVDELMCLLDSTRAEVISIGAWLLSEVPFATYDTASFTARLFELVRHPAASVRFNALAAVFPALSLRDARTQLLLDQLRRDPNDGVRRSAELAAQRLGME